MCLAAIKECLERGWTGIGYKTVEFEEAWKRYTGLPNAHFVNSGTAGLHVALHTLKSRLGWQEQDEVITTPFTFVSTNHAILYERLTPVFADIDESLCLDPRSIDQRLTARTRAVIFVGIAGNVGQYATIIELCRKNRIALIIDAAHMAGSYYKSVHIGQEADAVVFSFQAVKNLPTADSGMICFREQIDDQRARKLTWLGIDKDTYSRHVGRCSWKYNVEELGFKYNGNSIMAAIGLVQLEYLDQENAYRRQLARCYKETFERYDEIRMIPVTTGSLSSTHLFQIRVQHRDKLISDLNKHDVYPGVHYRDNTEYPMYRYAYGSCLKAQIASREVLSLPLHLGLTTDDAKMIGELVLTYALH
jgi:dTDP-4-amino-4,6-dideoxygalactose transaminase